MKTVSILVPVYNVEKFIQRCAESIFGQTYEQLDIVFVDDCSPDNSIRVVRETLERYPQRKGQVRIISHECNRGLAAARNTGVAVAKGDYIIHVDSDDYIDETTIAKCVDVVERKGADIVLFDANHVYPNKTVIDRVVLPPSDKEGYLKLLLSRKTRINIWGAMYKAELYKKYDIQAIEGCNIGEDYTVTPRLTYYARKVVNIPQPLYNYIHYNENSYTYKFSKKSVVSHIEIFKLLRTFFADKSNGEFMESIDYGETMYKSIQLLKWALTDNELQELDLVKKSFTTYPVNVPRSKKIILSLGNCPTLLKLYCRIGFHLKQMTK